MGVEYYKIFVIRHFGEICVFGIWPRNSELYWNLYKFMEFVLYVTEDRNIDTENNSLVLARRQKFALKISFF